MVKVRIGNIVWKVFGVERDNEKLESDEGETVMGITYFQEAEIYICVENTSTDVLLRTIQHELCHAALFSRGFTASSMDEEDICNFFESNAMDLCEKALDIFKELTRLEEEDGSPEEAGMNPEKNFTENRLLQEIGWEALSSRYNAGKMREYPNFPGMRQECGRGEALLRPEEMQGKCKGRFPDVLLRMMQERCEGEA